MLTKHDGSGSDTIALMADIGRKARAAARPLATVSTEAKNAALLAMADAILRDQDKILAANAIDIRNGEEAGLGAAVMDRAVHQGLCDRSKRSPRVAARLSPTALAASFRIPIERREYRGGARLRRREGAGFRPHLRPGFVFGRAFRS